MLSNVACAAQYPWRDGVDLVVALLVTGINECEVSSAYICFE